MKFTQYFLHTQKRSDRMSIKQNWLENVINHPLRTDIQSDGRIRKWGYVEEEKKYLRVILLEDGITLHNAFFDRNFREEYNDS